VSNIPPPPPPPGASGDDDTTRRPSPPPVPPPTGPPGGPGFAAPGATPPGPPTQQVPWGAPPPPGAGYPPPAGGFAPVPPPGAFGGMPTKESNGLAIAALVVGLVSLFLCQPAGIVAIILGIMGLNRSKQMAGNGKGLAIGGIVAGALAVVFFVVVIGFVVWAGNDTTFDFDTTGNFGDINSDPADGTCDYDRFMQDPDC
jgi:hypothetical protein